MENLNSYTINRWPFQDYKLVADLIDFEGPLLVHYASGSKNALYYWVEGNTNFNRWLCFEITNLELYNYLYQNTSLYEIIFNKASQYFFTVDIDKDLNYTNLQMVQGYLLPEKYYPDIDSFFLEDVELGLPIYEDFFEDSIRKPNIYSEKLRKNGIVLSLEPLQSLRQYSDTVAVIDAANFLRGVDASMSNYCANKFMQEYKETIDPTELYTTTRKMTRNSKPRMVDMKRGSLVISVATDHQMNQEKIKKEYEPFRKQLTSNYEKEILSLDLNDEQDIELILKKYNNEFIRNRIFEPLIRIINLPGYNLKYINRNNNKSRVLKKVGQYNKNKIITKQTKNVSEDEAKVFITVVLEAPQSTTVSSLSRRSIEEGTLSTKISSSIEQEFDRIEAETFDVIFSRPLYYIMQIVEGDYLITFQPLDIKVRDSNRKNVVDEFMKNIVSTIENDFLSQIPKNESNKKYWDDTILEIYIHEQG